MRRKRIGFALVFLLALVVSLPFLLNLEVFRLRVHQALERQLGRPVELASLTAELLPRPGFVARGVVIYDREEFGAEPMLYAEEMRCELSSRSLRGGGLVFSAIHFERPSLNLVRNAARAWNVGAPLLAAAPGGGSDDPAPVFTASDARINLKLGADKTVYALIDAQARAESLGGGRWQVELEGTPVRVDLRLNETGRLRLRGEVGAARDFAVLPFRMEATLDNASLAQWWTLVQGREPALRAQASLRAVVEGTPAAWKARGTLTLANLRRWDLAAPARSPRWEMDFALATEAGGPSLTVERATIRASRSEVQWAGRIENLFAQPQWELTGASGRLDVEELLGQWESLYENVSADLHGDGLVEFGLSGRGGLANWQGELAMPSGAALRVPGLPEPVVLEGFRLRLARGRVEVMPMRLRSSSASTLAAGGEVNLLQPGWPYRLRWQSENVALEPLWRLTNGLGWELFGSNRWGGRAQVNLEWRGEMQGGAAPRWQGEAVLREARLDSPRFNAPLEIPEARLAWNGPWLAAQTLEFRLGANAVHGSLERRNGRWVGTFEATRLRLADANELFNPARRSFLSRLVRPPVEAASGWEQFEASVDVRVEELAAGGLRLRQVQAQGEWSAGRLEWTRLRFNAYRGRFDGRLQADFRPSPAQYRLAGNVKQMDVAALLADTTRLGGAFTGLVSAEVALESAGAEPSELRRQLRGRVVGGVNHGSVVGVNLLEAMSTAAGEPAEGATATQPTKMESLAGEFQVGDEQVEFDAARLIVEGAALELSGRVGFDGSLNLRLTGAPLRVAGHEPSPRLVRLLSSPYRLTGWLPAPEVERVEALPPPEGPN